MKILCAALLLFVGTLNAFFDNNCCQPCGFSSLQIGANYTYVNFKVDDNATFHGNLGGLQGIYEYRASNNFYGALQASWKQGKTENSFFKRNLTYVDVQERLGFTYASCCHDWSLTFFSGFGYRYLGHRLSASDAPSIKFRYNEFYIPVGLLSEYCFNNCMNAGLNIIWMPQVFPTVEIVPLRGANWSLENELGNVRVELPLAYFFESKRCYCTSIIFKPFYERWEDGESTARASSGEALGLPKNSYNFWGVELNFLFLF